VNQDTKTLAKGCGLAALVAILLLACATWWEWYIAGQQAAIYAQQGITMTRWQVLIGVKPAPALQGGRR
jgi:low temperature requirement protein LtrA